MDEVLDEYLGDDPDPLFYVTVHSIRYGRSQVRIRKSRLNEKVYNLLRQQIDFSVTRHP